MASIPDGEPPPLDSRLRGNDGCAKVTPRGNDDRAKVSGRGEDGRAKVYLRGEPSQVTTPDGVVTLYLNWKE